MTRTMNDVRAALLPEEPNYAEARRLGAEAIPHLQTLIAGGDPMLAAKAAYLAGLIGTDAGVAAVTQAAGSPDPTVRVAAAAAAAALAQERGGAILEKLLTDTDRGVRRIALRSAAGNLTPALRARIMEMVRVESDRRLRNEAAALLGSGRAVIR